MFHVKKSLITGNCVLTVVGKPDLTPQRALELSVEKWAIIAQIAEAGLLIEEGGAMTCALCALYSGCQCCPVADDTDAAGCYDTPYMEYRRAYREGFVESGAWYARAEHDYLVRLLEENFGAEIGAKEV